MSHTWQYDGWCFHANGTPVPGPLHINQYPRPAEQTEFATTTQELLTFTMAVKVGAALENVPIRLGTTEFTTLDDKIHVLLRAHDDYKGHVKYFDRASDSMKEMIVPLEHLMSFAKDIVARHYEYYVESHRPSDDALMAGMGMFLLMMVAMPSGL
jgi:hypothetical protein